MMNKITKCRTAAILLVQWLLFVEAQNYTSEGCYSLGSQPVKQTSANNGPEKCYTQCIGYEAFALYDKKCYCDTLSSLESGGELLGSCTISCPDGSGATCGGLVTVLKYINVYRITTTTTTTLLTTTSNPTTTTTIPDTTTTTSKAPTTTTSTLPITTTTTTTAPATTTTTTGQTSTTTILITSTKAPTSTSTTLSQTTSTSTTSLSPTTSTTFLYPTTSTTSIPATTSTTTFPATTITTSKSAITTTTSKSATTSTTSKPETTTTTSATLSTTSTTAPPATATTTTKPPITFATSKAAITTATSKVAMTSTTSKTTITLTTSKPVTTSITSMHPTTDSTKAPTMRSTKKLAATTSKTVTGTLISSMTQTTLVPLIKLITVEEVYGSVVRTCVYSEWFNYSQCSATCGDDAVQKRTRLSITGGLCVKVHETKKCHLPKCNPLDDTLAVVAAVIQALGCTYLLGIVGFTLVACFICKIDTYERVIQASEEVALFLAHIVIWSLGNKFDNPNLCQLSAGLLQFFFIALFTFLMFESLQAYCVLTNVIFFDGILTKFSTLVIGWGVPALYSISTVAFSRYHLTSTFSCWLNMDSNWSLTITGPCLILTCLSFILAEAGGMEKKRKLTLSVDSKRITAEVSQKGLILKIPLHLACWLAGLLTVHYRYFPMYLVVFGLNVSLGIVIILFHTLGAEKVRALIKKAGKKTKQVLRRNKLPFKKLPD